MILKVGSIFLDQNLASSNDTISNIGICIFACPLLCYEFYACVKRCKMVCFYNSQFIPRYYLGEKYFIFFLHESFSSAFT